MATVPPNLATAPETSGLHIHHIKLLQKTEEEREEREQLYQRVYQARIRERIKEARKDLLAKIWYGTDPFDKASRYVGREDFQGWASEHPYLRSSVDEIRPDVIVEIGVWKGGSTMTMAEQLVSMKIVGLVISVDTWLGSWDHWLQPEWFASLRIEDGFPTLYRTFMANVLERSLQDYVIPLPIDSMSAAQILRARNIVPKLIHLDGAQDYNSVTSDLRAWWPLLSIGGILIGDDYHPHGETWPEVRHAFQDFFQSTDIENEGGKCLVRKTPI